MSKVSEVAMLREPTKAPHPPYLAPPNEIYGRCVGSAISKQAMGWGARAWHGFMAGFWVAIGAHTAIACGGGARICTKEADELVCSVVMGPGPTKLLSMVLFPAGILAVIIFGHDLFTSSCSLMMQGYLQKRVKFSKMIMGWVTSFFFNLCGALFVAFFLSYLSGLFENEPYLSYVRYTGASKTFLPEPYQILLRAIGCNVLVNTAIWQATGTRDVAGKVIVCWLPIVAFGVAGFEHVVANQYYIPVSMMYGSSVSLSDAVMGLTMACIGNWIGAVCFVAVPTWWLYHNDYEANNPLTLPLKDTELSKDIEVVCDEVEPLLVD